MLLVVAGLFVRSSQNAEHTYLGFDPHNVLNLTMETRTIGFDQPRTEQFFRDDGETAFACCPACESVSLAASVPMGYSNEGGHVFAEGQTQPAKKLAPSAFYNVVDPPYFTTMRDSSPAWTALTEQDTAKTPMVAVINEAMANKLWPGQDPLGKRFSDTESSGPFLEVVGIAKQGKYNDPVDTTTMFYYQPIAQNFRSFADAATAHLPLAGSPDSSRRAANPQPGSRAFP